MGLGQRGVCTSGSVCVCVCVCVCKGLFKLQMSSNTPQIKQQRCVEVKVDVEHVTCPISLWLKYNYGIYRTVSYLLHPDRHTVSL